MNKESTLGSTFDLIPIKEIKNNLLILDDGGLRRVLLVSGINFELKSEQDQNVLIYAFQDFLNSLKYPLQIIIHSRKLNITSYLENIRSAENIEENTLLKTIMKDYSNFISDFVKNNPIMEKTFFVVIPYDSFSLSGAKTSFKNIFRQKKSEKNEEDETEFREKVKNIDLRVDEVTAGLSRIGLRSVALETEELIELFQNFTHPQTIENHS
jgi:hypothetical protein